MINKEQPSIFFIVVKSICWSVSDAIANAKSNFCHFDINDEIEIEI